MPRTSRNADASQYVPLKPLVFHILVTLADGERHGWSLVRDAQQRGGFRRLMPGNFYRTLRTMLAEGLIEESARRPTAEKEDERRRYFRITRLGSDVAAAEMHRLETVLLDARCKRFAARSR